MTFTFHLAGINNQNFLMRDEETGSFWQQISGRAISGPLTGAQLLPIHSDEMTFGLWRREAPFGTVLKPAAKYAAEYEEKDWDVRMSKVRTVLDFPNTPLKSRDLIFGVTAFGASRAYSVSRITSSKLVQDRLNSEPILLVLGPDEKSIRVFQARFREGEAAPDYYRKLEPGHSIGSSRSSDPAASLFMDSATGSDWSFRGCAVAGPMHGTCLKQIWGLKDYWFDWRNYHPETTIYGR